MPRLPALLLLLALAAPALLAHAGPAYGGPNDSGGAVQGSGDHGNGTRGNGTDASQHGGARDRGNATGNATREDDAQEEHDRMAWERTPMLKRSLGLQHAERARLFAELTLRGGEAGGRFVSFRYNATDGDLADYRALDLNATFFRLVHAEGFAPNGTPEVHGSAFRVRGDGASLAVHNNPTAQLDVRGANLTVRFDLAPGIAAGNVTGNRTVRLNAASGQHGHLVLLGDGAISTTASGFAIRLADGGVMFLAHPARTATGDALHDVVDAGARGKLGAIASVVDADGSPLGDADSWGVQVRAERSGDRTLTLNISSDDPAGKAVVLRTDNSSVPAGKPDDVIVTLDGATLPRAADAADAIDNGTTGARGKAFVSVTDGGIQVVVGVPHFSSYLLAIGSALPAGQPGPAPSPGGPNGTSPAKGAPGFEPLAVLGAVAVLALARRRRA